MIFHKLSPHFEFDKFTFELAELKFSSIMEIRNQFKEVQGGIVGNTSKGGPPESISCKHFASSSLLR